MVVAQEPFAADVGVAVLKAGGNAVDAAIAVGFALAVTYPYAGNLGGGGFMLVRLADGRATFLDFRERAPGKASRNMYLDENGNATPDSRIGWRAAGVPGTVRGLELAHKKFGTKPWAELLKPAIRLAANGFPVDYWSMQALRSENAVKRLSQFPESKRIFLKNGAFYDLNETLRQPELARTLARIARFGAKDFYEGQTARILAAEMEKNGGLITLDDLKGYTAVERSPLEGSYKGYQILTAPPPSSGGFGILQMLGMLEGSGYEKGGAGAASTIHYVAEVMRRCYADRSEYSGDADFVHVPVKSLLDPAYIRKRRESIDPNRATPSVEVHPGLTAMHESSETTHFNIVDEQGNAVALTYTLNSGFGDAVTVPGLGFLLNNEMDDFSAKPGSANEYQLIQGEANAIAPRRHPVSSMTPTIVLRDNKPFLVLGGPGGSRIPTAVLQVILNVIDFGRNVQDAVDQPRFHHQWSPDQLELEPGFSPDTIALLEAKGHNVVPLKASVVARVEAILIDDGWLQGGHDERANGKAAGY
jgi:gamma-glutamyltranspeptidase / glutathione hydrolase